MIRDYRATVKDFARDAVLSLGHRTVREVQRLIHKGWPRWVESAARAELARRARMEAEPTPPAAHEAMAAAITAQRERALLKVAHMINDSDGDEGRTIRAHLITMGWRPPT